jgi:nucleoside 2-deoxyribosyltransferase
MTRVPKIYLAGPDVFLEDAVAMGQRKKALCAHYGFEGLYPLDDNGERNRADVRQDLFIYRACVTHMRAADLAIFNLTPFRGASADAGTVFELGYFVGLGKPVFAYTNDAEDLIDRVKRSGETARDAATGDWRDAMGMSIEDFGNADNLMIDMALYEQHHPIIRHAARPEERFTDLTGFEACLRHAAKVLSSEST